NRYALVSATLVGVGARAGQSPPCPLDEPMRTVTAKGDRALVQAFLVKYYGAGCGQGCGEPLHTITTKDRLGLVMVQGEAHEIVDIGMRMLQPHELAKAQGFPDDYRLEGTKSTKVRLIGNSVCPDVAAALVRANFKAQEVGNIRRAGASW